MTVETVETDSWTVQLTVRQMAAIGRRIKLVHGRQNVMFVLGPPGSGKGTQCELIQDRLGWKHLSAGELLRQEQELGTSNGKLIAQTIREGGIVPVSITLQLLQQAMSQTQQNLFLIDGFPRNFDNLQVSCVVRSSKTLLNL